MGLVIEGPVAIADFNATPRKPWDQMGFTDGHDTLGIQTHADGSGTLVTWGGLQPYTADFRAKHFQDAWVIFDSDDSFVDWVALEAALTEVHGPHTNPVPIPDPPVAPVVPQVAS